MRLCHGSLKWSRADDCTSTQTMRPIGVPVHRPSESLPSSSCAGTSPGVVMQFERDFTEFLECLDAHDVRFLVVGGYAVAAHGRPALHR